MMNKDTYRAMADEECEISCREVNSEGVSSNCEKSKIVYGEHEKVNIPDYEQTITKLKELSDKLITSQEPEIIRGCVKEIQLNSPNCDFAELCESFFTGDSTRIDVRREVLKLYDDLKKKQILNDMEVIAKNYDMSVDEILDFLTSSDDE